MMILNNSLKDFKQINRRRFDRAFPALPKPGVQSALGMRTGKSLLKRPRRFVRCFR